MSAAEAWKEIVRAALLGTERQPAPVDAVTGDAALDGTLAALADRSAEARLLGTAALLDGWRRAGQRPLSAPPPAEPAPEGDAPVCPPRAAQVLRQLLAGGPPAVVAEWMRLGEAAGAAIPHEMLPEVLDFGGRNVYVRDAIARLLGARGRWLAALNPAWSFATDVGGDPAAGWETGTAEERVRILRHVRSADPAAGLALVQSTWATDPPKERAAFVEALEAGLGMDDEPFLESALDDKRKDVRTAAARLLARLPDSRLVGRMVERLDPLLALHAPDGLLARIRQGRPRIEVQLPAACDRAMQRDGIEPKPPYGTGERTWWLRQMVAAVPPSAWTARWEMDAAACIEAARANKDDGATLVEGWAEATIHAGDAEWAEALVRTGGAVVDTTEKVAHLLPRERLEALALERLPQGHLDANEPAVRLLRGADHPWSPALTRAALGAIPSVAPLPGRGRVVLGYRMEGYALFLHPATAVAVLRERGDPYEGEWVDLIHLRHTLHQAFS